MNKVLNTFVNYDDQEIRRAWHNEQWFFAVSDVIGALTESKDPKSYWRKLKERDKQLVTICHGLRLRAIDGRMRVEDCANIEGIFRLIQSVPSKKVEPFKQWLARVGKERIEEIRDPELAMKRMRSLYEQKGYNKEWIAKRERSIAVRNDLTTEWEERGAKEGREFAILTNEIYQGAFEMKAAELKQHKGLKQENLRDHMGDIELLLTALGEATATRLTRNRDTQGFEPLKTDAREGGEVAGGARKDIERRIGGSVITSSKYLPNTKNLKN